LILDSPPDLLFADEETSARSHHNRIVSKQTQYGIPIASDQRRLAAFKTESAWLSSQSLGMNRRASANTETT
jgi:hypothetical protein